MSFAVPIESVGGSGPESRSRCWSVSGLVFVIWSAIALSYSFLFGAILQHLSVRGGLGHTVWHVKPWMQPADVWAPIEAGRYVWYGAFGYVYQGAVTYALPLSFIVSAPIAGLIDHFHLVEGTPYPVPRPSAWLLVAPYSLSFGLPLLIAVRRLAWDLGVRRRGWTVQVASVLVVLLPAACWGHFEDVLALTFLLFAVRRILRSEWIPGALLLSLAISSKQWAIMALPLVLAIAPRGTRLKILAMASALPVALTLFVLGADWKDASRALFMPINLGRNTQGHLSLYASWFGRRTSQWSRTLGMLSAIPLAWAFRRLRRPVCLIAAIGLIMLVRPFSEAIMYSYYLCPAMLMAGLVSVAAHRSFRLRDWIAPIGAVLWALPRGNPATSGFWWLGFLLLAGISAAQVVTNVRQAAGFGIGAEQVVKNYRRRPIFQAMRTVRVLGD